MKDLVYDFGWGDPEVVREEFKKSILNSGYKVADFGYQPHEGNRELINAISNYYVDRYGKTYGYILVTNGATNALFLALNSLNGKTVKTKNYYFSLYPSIIGLSGKEHVIKGPSDIILTDSPSNPEGVIDGNPCDIWDSAYHSPTYGATAFTGIPEHKIMVGTASKMFGLSGARVGWLATNNADVYKKCLEISTNTICGVNGASQAIVKDALNSHYIGDFFLKSSIKIDNNREELSKIGQMIGQVVPSKGMFCLWQVDDLFKNLLTRAGVKWTDGAGLGATSDHIRLSLGRSNEITKEMVNKITNIDKLV